MLLTKAELDLNRFASRDESRYGISVLAIQSDVTVATDGHILGCVNHDGIADKDFPVTPGLTPQTVTAMQRILVEADAAKKAVKNVAKKNTIPVLTRAALGEDRKLYTNTLDRTASFGEGGPQADSRFPNWEMIVPAGKPVFQIAVNPELLERIAHYLRQHECSSARLSFYGENRAIRFDGKLKDDYQNAMFLLMPMRLENSEENWVKLPHEAKGKPSTGQAA